MTAAVTRTTAAAALSLGFLNVLATVATAPLAVIVIVLSAHSSER